MKADLHTDANRPIARVGPASCFHWVVVDVNDLVQVLGDLLCDVRQLVKVKVPVMQECNQTMTRRLKRSQKFV